MVSSEMDLFFRLCPAPIVGITGTNGKTTTTALVGQVLDQTGRPVMVGGNIGETVLDRLAEVTEDHLVVLELSSFQLESISQPNMAVAAVLNLTPDHLDRHGSMSRYIDAKARAVEFLAGDGHAVLNGLDENCRGLAMRTHANVVWFDQHQPLPPVTIPGRHNLLNALAAASIGRILGLDDQRIASSIAAFKGVEHRLELVGNWGGVAWYNDSKATNPEAGEVALQAFPDRPLILIAGGQGQFDLRRWATVVQARAQAVILIGSDPTALADSLSGHPDVRVAGTLDMAVEAAGAIARAGNVVLFSPAFKSFDQFANFEARGRAFKSLVLERGGTR
jgi:UDP-N-acetylmuramoylalanine--D-glutamate ligase